MEHEGGTYAVVRTWWDRRIWADLSNSRMLKDVPAALVRAAEQSDRQWALRTLEGASARLAGIPEQASEYWNAHSAVIAAIHLAGRMKLAEALPAIRELQRSEYWDLSTSGRGKYGADGVDPLAFTNRGVRQHAALALRRLGERPLGLPCHTFQILRDGSHWEPLHLSQPDLPREAAVSNIRKGMGVLEVLKVLGAPDVIAEERVTSGLARWEYDLDGPEPCTLSIIWDGAASVAKTERSAPAWESLRRDESLCRR